MKKLILVLTILIVFHRMLYAQQQEIELNYFDKLIVSVRVMPYQSKLIYQSIYENTTTQNDSKFTYGMSLDLSYYFTKNIGISTGLGIRNLAFQLSLINYSLKIDKIDTESESYQMQIECTDIKEGHKYSYYSVPVLITFRYPVSTRIKIHAGAGINLNTLFTSNYDATGTFTYIGYYPEYNVSLSEMPEYGFYTNASRSINSQTEMNPFFMGAIAEVGVHYIISKAISLSAGYYFDTSITKLMVEPNSNYLMTTKYTDYNSLINSAVNPKLRLQGAFISFNYKLM